MENSKIYTVTIINTVDCDAANWTASFSSQDKASAYHDRVKDWIERHGLSDTLKIEEDCTELDSEEYIDWLEETYGNE